MSYKLFLLLAKVPLNYDRRPLVLYKKSFFFFNNATKLRNPLNKSIYFGENAPAIVSTRINIILSQKAVVGNKMDYIPLGHHFPALTYYLRLIASFFRTSAVF